MSARTATVTPCDSKGTWLITLHRDHDLTTRTILELQTGGISRAPIEVITGREVIAFISGIDTRTDIASELFLLEPLQSHESVGS